ncbi:LysR substrate-binding domain-containing protein [Shimia sp.]|uniref:LysR substrate-binding domain-containing protein n=1 Tax=Shimia sp. TaxID=1954381 RepID=UPI00329A395B
MTSAPKLRQLKVLKLVADYGSMTRAAKSLEISQPAVSRVIADLTDSFGFSLFDRKDGRLVPSQETRYILPDIARVIELMDHIQDTSSNLTARRAGHLRVACLPGFSTSHLPKIVADFLKDRPDVTITIEPDRPERILEWIIGEQYDCGITDAFEGHPTIERTKIDIRTVCIFPLGHRLENLTEVTPADLNDERLIHTRRDSYFFHTLNEVFREHSVSPTQIAETRQFTGACELVSLGAGVSIVSELDARTYEGRLGFRPFAPIIPHQLSLVRPIHQAPSMIAVEFMEKFKESLNDLTI